MMPKIENHIQSCIQEMFMVREFLKLKIHVRKILETFLDSHYIDMISK